jgi:LPXTG-site transpeptidase (sortase) family protein
VLSGHISSPREGAVFNKLPKVQVGDGIIVSTPDRQYLYVVAETKTVTPDTVEVLDPTDHAIVTMITCVTDGSTRTAGGSRRSRLVASSAARSAHLRSLLLVHRAQGP